MNQDLRRIRAALQAMKQTALGDTAIAPQTVTSPLPCNWLQQTSALIRTANTPMAAPQLPALPSRQPPLSRPSSALPGQPVLTTSQPSLSATNERPHPMLPTVQSFRFTTHRNVANPNLSMNLLKELQQRVATWQKELQQVTQQIQAVYLEGPIIDGWLESELLEGGGRSTFHHVDAHQLMAYLENSLNLEMEKVSPSQIKPGPTRSRGGYRLCGLNEDGQLWFRDCPPEQVAAVSLAIARYQRLQLLTQRRQTLETQLGQMAQSLINLHAQMSEACHNNDSNAHPSTQHQGNGFNPVKDKG